MSPPRLPPPTGHRLLLHDGEMGRITLSHAVHKISGGQVRSMADRLVVEEPLEIRINGIALAVTMRTPGDDIDLVHGLLNAEGVIAAPADIAVARYCDGVGPDGLNTYNVIDVRLADGVAEPESGLTRNVLTSSACGVCGAASIDQVRRDSRHRLGQAVRFDANLLLAAPELLRTQQKTFDRTGGLHGAGLLSESGELLCVREDVGRHNAVDKVIGWALRNSRLPLSRAALIVSGRASFELTQKALMAGIPVLVAVSAPSSLAVELAEEAGLTLIGFARQGSMNVYTEPARVNFVAPA